MKRFAVIGFGCAGYHAARALRSICPGDAIDVYESAAAGSNPMLTTYYAGARIGFDQLFPFGSQEEIGRELGLNFCVQRVKRVDTALRRVELESGEAHTYDSILISTGASALKPSFIKYEGRQVFLMRTPEDAGRLKEHLEQNHVKTAAVIGASMVGIKVAELLHGRGIHTALMDAEENIFPLAAYPTMARQIERELISAGLELRLGVRVKAVSPEGVVFSDGSVFPADVVCLCIGTRANVELVANTDVVEGQGILIRRGIVVSERMETSCPGIYAAGDCCEGTNLQTGETTIIALWANAAAQGTCAGRNMAGATERYYGNFPHNITHFFGLTFAGLGDPALKGEHISFKGKDLTVELVKDGGRLCSMNLFGDCRISGVMKSILLRQFSGEAAPLSAAQRALFKSAGLPAEFISVIGGVTE